MPKGVVETPREVALWAKAKAAAREQYPDVKEGSKRFWKIVMGIFKKMQGG